MCCACDVLNLSNHSNAEVKRMTAGIVHKAGKSSGDALKMPVQLRRCGGTVARLRANFRKPDIRHFQKL